jgi:2-oxoglutarate/2-oxoacid ferredoxin oxidoreductase subunit beta
MVTTQAAPPTLTRKDFQTNQEVRWCPGCGDYAILATMQRVLPALGVPREKTVFVSGIGCSSRFPYYMNTYGFHTIHGRAPAVATGVKLANPDLSVWVITGDGDGLSIGAGHLMHALRRNVGLKIILFNNRIYGLTKGQYSPTSEFGKKTKSTPTGSVDEPFEPLSVALGANASFVARSIDVEPKHLEQVLLRAAAHSGTAFVEIFQNCNIFNDGAFQGVTEKSEKLSRQLRLEHGAPLRFGNEHELGIVLGGQSRLTPEVVNLKTHPDREKDLLIHDEQDTHGALPFLLSRLAPPEFPVPIGVFRDLERPAYEVLMSQQMSAARRKKASMHDLLRSGDTWQIA